MRLIDADALLRDMETVCSSTQFGRSTAKMCIKRALTIDPDEYLGIYIFNGEAYCAEELISRLADTGNIFIKYDGEKTFEITL